METDTFQSFVGKRVLRLITDLHVVIKCVNSKMRVKLLMSSDIDGTIVRIITGEF